MAGVHRLEHVKGFIATYFADDDAIRPHPQRVTHKLALRYMADALDIGRPGLHLHDMRLLQTKLDGIFDGDDPLVTVDMARYRIQQRRFARAGATRDQDVDTASRRDIEELRHLGRDVPLPNHRFEGDILRGKFADRNCATVQDQRWQNDIDAAAIGETGIDHRAGLVNAATDPGGNSLRNIDDVLDITEPCRGLFEFAAALDIDVKGSVDQDIGNRVIIE